ncbi:MAG: aminotransferase class IV [Deltaproteobacteria bacterium]|nr:aminotransferase class IV [Deltaproteobacteria bacterium]
MERIGCYTTARVTGGRIERIERHAGRLRRDAGRLGLARPERPAIEEIALAAVRAELGRGGGIVRIEWSGAEPRLSASTRPLGAEPGTWRAITARALHPGPAARAGTKALDVPAWDAARAERSAAGVEESLLFDGAGRLVEGSRTNLVVVTEEGLCLTPARGLGPVEGLGLELAREAVPAIVETLGIDRRTLARARELVAVNAVRGAVAIVELDGSPVGDGRSGPLAQRLRVVFPTGRVIPERLS